MDSNIQQLQLRLMHHGYNILTATGTFDTDTISAIRVFQKDHGLTPDGIAGKNTQAAINQYCIVGNNEPETVGSLSRFLITSYMSACESDSGNNKIIPAVDDNGHTLAILDTHFFANLALEGTGKLDDGRVLNVTGKYVTAPQIVRDQLLPTCKQMFGLHYTYGGINADASKYFAYKVLAPQFPWGVGIHNEPLKLWRSLAADQSLIPFGTKVYILELDGMTLPDGFIHDGWCQVDDTGSAIRKNHFDWFVGKNSFMKQIHRFDVLHIWFQGSEDIFPKDYQGVV